MEYQINGVFPWGRCMSEYMHMFSLTKNDLTRSILDCAGGPASFNAEWTAGGGIVVSCDPLYQFSAEEIERRVRETFPVILSNVETNPQDFVWSELIPSPAHLGRIRMHAMRTFLKDYPAGLQQSRYLPDPLPYLPMPDHSFDLALVSHFLFLYSEQHSADFHLRALLNLHRVAREVRVFPLLDMSHRRSPHLEEVLYGLDGQSINYDIRPVDYEFQRGACEMLVLS